MIPLHALLLYCGIYAAAIATPGPGIFAIIGRALGGGFRSTIPAVLGNTLGDLILMSLSAFGLAVVARQMGGLFLVVKLAGAAYLIWLGYKSWTADAKAAGELVPARNGFWSQLALTLGNPKAIMMFVALLPTVVDLNHLNLTGYLQLCLCTLLLIPGIEFLYAALASQARAFLSGPRARRRMNRGAGAIMIGAGVGVAVS
ncbi:MAG TPA: LysE family translocator [Rhizomicrobium sp.]|nr:LysE family translocator [Rhizomicrobium sp.]